MTLMEDRWPAAADGWPRGPVAGGRQALVDRLDAALHRLRRHPDATFAVLDVCADPEHGAPPATAEELDAALRNVLWAADLTAGLAPGRFAVCCEDVADEHAAASLARRVADALGAAGAAAVSVGVAVATPEHEVADELLAEAAFAMTCVRAGGGGYQLSDPAHGDSAASRMRLEASMRLGLERCEFRVVYQPAYRLADGAMVGVEALLRWDHPSRGLVSPAGFMAAAESSHLILPIGRWVLQETCRQLAAWRDEHPEVPLVGSVNLSAAQLADPLLAEDVRLALAVSQIDPGSLCLEINESVLMADPATSERALRRLRAEGVRLAIDDFGTGSSSLSWLERFPIDHLKVDGTFVSGIGNSHVDTAVVRAVIGLASALGLSVVAEGVETAHQLDVLRGLGCAAGQGHLWGQPGSARTVSAALAAPPAAGLPALDVGGAGGAASNLGGGGRHDVLDLLVHELRTPLTVIRGFAETLAACAAEGDDALMEVGLGAICRQVEGIDAMFKTLLDSQAIGSGTLRLDCVEVSADELFPQVVAELASAAPGRRLAFERSGPAGARIAVDPGRIREVLGNLIGNAVKYSPPCSDVEVVLEVAEDEVVVHVVDHGPGVPPERVGDVFRKFARLDRDVRGTGLGLYIARGIARSHGGELECRPAPGGGADFVLRLPTVTSRPA